MTTRAATEDAKIVSGSPIGRCRNPTAEGSPKVRCMFSLDVLSDNDVDHQPGWWADDTDCTERPPLLFRRLYYPELSLTAEPRNWDTRAIYTGVGVSRWAIHHVTSGPYSNTTSAAHDKSLGRSHGNHMLRRGNTRTSTR